MINACVDDLRGKTCLKAEHFQINFRAFPIIASRENSNQSCFYFCTTVLEKCPKKAISWRSQNFWRGFKIQKTKTRICWFDSEGFNLFSDLASQINRFIWLAVFVFWADTDTKIAEVEADSWNCNLSEKSNLAKHGGIWLGYHWLSIKRGWILHPSRHK